MQEKIELNRVRDFNEVIEDTIQFFKQTWRPLLKAYFSICGFFLMASLIVAVFNVTNMMQRAAIGDSSPFSLTYFLAVLFNMLDYIMVSLTVLSFIALYKEKGNEPPVVAEVWGYVKFYFLRAAGSYIALGALIFAGTICCLIPGIYLTVVLSLVLPVMIMENSTLGYAFSRSFLIIKNNWWFTFAVILVLFIILMVIMVAIAIPASAITYASLLITKTSPISIYSYALVIVGHLFQFFYIIPLIGITLSYFSFTEMKDEGTLMQRIMMLGKSSTDVHEPPTEEY